MGFGEDLRKLIEKRKGDVNRVVRGTAIDLMAGMVEKTPVDLGHLAGNWQCGIGALNPDTSSPPGSDAVARTREALSTWKYGQPIYLTNSMAYAYTVEYGLFGKPPGSANGPKTVGGYSSQAQQGMVRLTAQEFAQKLHKQVQAIK